MKFKLNKIKNYKRTGVNLILMGMFKNLNFEFLGLFRV